MIRWVQDDRLCGGCAGHRVEGEKDRKKLGREMRYEEI